MNQAMVNGLASGGQVSLPAGWHLSRFPVSTGDSGTRFSPRIARMAS